jgi:hypothetical protein
MAGFFAPSHLALIRNPFNVRSLGRSMQASGLSLAALGRRMAGILISAVKTGLLGLIIGPLIAVVLVFGAMIFDPKCGVGDSGGCAMGVVTAPIAIALPSFALFFAFGLVRALWRRRPADPKAAIAKLRNWGRED